MTRIPADIETIIHKVKSAPKGKVTDAQRRLAAACEAMAAELERRKTEDHARFHLAAIVESANVAIVSKSLDGIILSWNPGAERLYGYRAEEMVKRSIAKLLPEGAEGEELTIMAKLKRGEPVMNYETLRRHKDGRLVPVSLSISPVRNDEGRIIAAAGIAQDMAERRERQAQAALIDQLQSALGEIKMLRGFIPICAHCKKIRDDSGHWHGLEQYLSRHTTVRFSHGVCPGCMGKHYGEMMSSQLI